MMPAPLPFQSVALVDMSNWKKASPGGRPCGPAARVHSARRNLFTFTATLSTRQGEVMAHQRPHQLSLFQPGAAVSNKMS